jgi:dihydroneopterin aldolase
MTDEIRQAFAHPEERACAIGGLPDRLSLRDYVVSADIGAFHEERGASQRLRFNIVVEIAPLAPGVDDDVDRILSYDRLIEAVGAELAAGRFNLLETLAEGIAARILAEPQARRVFLRIEKTDRGPFALGVEIVRDRAAQPVAEIEAPRPVIVHVAGDLVGAPDMAARLAPLLASGVPLVLTVGLPGNTALPEAVTPTASRRVALLALEQTAWRLAAHDPRITVVASRTELDWALRNGRPAVWAPAKLVLDTPGAPLEQADDGAALALWLAGVLDATRIAVHGDVTFPAGSRVPVVRA